MRFTTEIVSIFIVPSPHISGKKEKAIHTNIVPLARSISRLPGRNLSDGASHTNSARSHHYRCRTGRINRTRQPANCHSLLDMDRSVHVAVNTVHILPIQTTRRAVPANENPPVLLDEAWRLNICSAYPSPSRRLMRGLGVGQRAAVLANIVMSPADAVIVTAAGVEVVVAEKSDGGGEHVRLRRGIVCRRNGIVRIRGESRDTGDLQERVPCWYCDGDGIVAKTRGASCCCFNGDYVLGEDGWEIGEEEREKHGRRLVVWN
jgi:hypothetical protein